MKKLSLGWRVRFKTQDGMFTFVNIKRKNRKLHIDEVREWAELRVEQEEYYSSVDSIEPILD